MPKRALFIVPHYRNRSPGQRFRHEQYLTALEADGWTIDYQNLLTPETDKLLSSPGRYAAKAKLLMDAFRKRASDLKKAEEADVVFLYREAIMVGTTFFESRMQAKSAKIIFDFDDSIWLKDVSAANQTLGFLKRPQKTSDLIALSDLVFAGNAYLAEYAYQYNSRVEIVPTTIDTDEYQPVPLEKDPGKVCIGWSGSKTTVKHFETAVPVLERIQQQFGDGVGFKLIGDGNYTNEQLGLQGQPWQKATELSDLSAIDIGIMPLPDDPWSRGKCGLKGLQYMALGIPTVMSPVGVNKDIIQHGENGFLASTPEEWEDCLTQLIQSPELRQRLGEAGRQTVQQHYSVDSLRDRYVQLFNSLLPTQK